MMKTSVMQDHLVNDLPTGDAFPPEKIFAITIKFFIDHHSTTSITVSHVDLLVYTRIFGFGGPQGDG